MRDEDLAPTVEGDDFVERVERPAALAVIGSNVGAESANGAMDRDVRERVNPRGDLLFGMTVGGGEEEDGVIKVDDCIPDDHRVR